MAATCWQAKTTARASRLAWAWIRGQAIEKLKEKPLSLSKQEVEQIVAEMKNEMLKGLIREYKDLTKDIKNHREFKEPAIQEQTILGKMET